MKQYIVDAFTDQIFKGNPAAVCVVEEWPGDETMLNMAKENNLSETAFAKKNPDGTYDLRWFTPADEIDFCGHATLATSFTLFTFYEQNAEQIVFHTRYKGDFIVNKNSDGIRMTFPAFAYRPVEVTDAMEKAFGSRPIAAYMDRDLMCVFEDASLIPDMKPAKEDLLRLDGLCIAVTAKAREDYKDYDCVSRVFAPDLNIYEDPVTGSTHCMIAPYWAEILGKDSIKAYQASERGGDLFCQVRGSHVDITGSAVLYAITELDPCKGESKSQGMTLNQYQKLAMRTLNPQLDKKDILINSVMGLCGESGEAIDIVKKWLAQGHELDREHLIKELGDIAWYLAEAATALETSLEEICSANIAKLKKRYPEGFDSKKSINR